MIRGNHFLFLCYLSDMPSVDANEALSAPVVLLQVYIGLGVDNTQAFGRDGYDIQRMASDGL